MTILPGQIRQIGYVVTDLDRAIAKWVDLGVGPWFVMRHLSQRVDYRGQPTEITISLALSNSGDLQVELIQPVAIEEGLRFAIREGGRTVGAGVVTSIVK